MSLLEFIKEINKNYAGVLSLITTLLLVWVTIRYVVYTRKQANYAKESVDSMAKQFMVEKQPCIVPKILGSHGCAFDTSTYTRIQLSIDILLTNVGDAPAINVYTTAEISLQHSTDSSGANITVNAALLPDYTQAILIGGKEKTSIHFETNEVLMLVDDLKTNMDLNWKRIEINPTQHHIVGAILIINTYCRNIMGQWFKGSLAQEIAWLEHTKPSKKESCNMNEHTIPPDTIHVGDVFKVLFTTSKRAPFDYRMISEANVTSMLSDFADESPWISNHGCDMES